MDRQTIGPTSDAAMQQALAEGRINESALAWREGLPQWVTVGELLREWETTDPGEASPAKAEADSGPEAAKTRTAEVQASGGEVDGATEAGEAAQGVQAGEPGETLVAVEGVTKAFGDKVALRGISFAVPAGQICGLLGPNGAGKTTLFRLMMGILKATEGRLLVDGLDAFGDRIATKRLIGFLPDEPVFYSYLSGREILELSAAMHGLEVHATMRRIGPLARQLRLADDLHAYAEDYSRGTKKKLGLLLAMLHEPKLLILDEPTNGMDVESTQLFYEIVRGEAARGTTVLFSTHLMDHVARLCSHAVIINEGQVIARGELRELRERFEEATLEEIFLKLTTRAAQKG